MRAGLSGAHGRHLRAGAGCVLPVTGSAQSKQKGGAIGSAPVSGLSGKGVFSGG